MIKAIFVVVSALFRSSFWSIAYKSFLSNKTIGGEPNYSKDDKIICMKIETNKKCIIDDSCYLNHKFVCEKPRLSWVKVIIFIISIIESTSTIILFLTTVLFFFNNNQQISISTVLFWEIFYSNEKYSILTCFSKWHLKPYKWC